MLIIPFIRFILASSLAAMTLTAFAFPARAGEYRAIAAGVAGGVAGSIAGESLSGALPPPGSYGPYQQQPQCWAEHRQEETADAFHYGTVHVCN